LPGAFLSQVILFLTRDSENQAVSPSGAERMTGVSPHQCVMA
jgi:hypothetical protein